MRESSYLTATDLPMDASAIKRSFAGHVEYTLAKDEYSATPRDFYHAIALAVRDRIADRWNKTQQRQFRQAGRRIYYLSLEYLVGRLLDDALINLDLTETATQALGELGLSLDELSQYEDEAGLGNGGLGRLAACFLDSMATLDIAAVGYGIRYEYGIFRQIITNGAQIEKPDNWLRYPSPWEVARPERLYKVRFGGRVEMRRTDGRDIYDWIEAETVMAMAYDVPIPGYRNNVVNTLRLWSAKATREFDIESFSRGDYIAAIHDKTASENLARVLYPNDQVAEGRELRLRQEYFFIAATLQDALRRHRAQHRRIDNLQDAVVFQLNDTHPTLAIVELLRILLDEEGMDWDTAWMITCGSFAYTNHTVLPEALEQWPVALLGRLLPRHLQLIYEINHRFLTDVRSRHPGDEARVVRMSLIDETGERTVRMAHLAVVGSHAVNGVSQLHGRILRERLLADFAALWPHKFHAITNGITPRRWLRKCNPALAALITAHIGDGWVADLEQLAGLRPHAEDPEFRRRFRTAKLENKQRLLAFAQSTLGIGFDPESLVDVQIKRIHEYKRQLLAVLHAIALYQELQSDGQGRTARALIFAGKAAPGYDMAKRIIRLIHDVTQVVNADPRTAERLRILFLPNYDVTLAELIIPAADLSEQISTAGTEASGTGNMKLALNGALTIGTLDGANIELRDAVGAENLFVFGLTEPEIAARQRAGGQGQRQAQGPDTGNPQQLIARQDPVLAAVLEALWRGDFCPDEPTRHRPIVESLLFHDRFFVLADFPSYAACQRQIEAVYRDSERWARMAVLNVAGMGRFSSDVTVAQYARQIWRVPVRRPGR